MKHKLTRLTSLLLAFIMAFSMLLVPVQAAEFSDVQSNSWYSEAVDYVHEKGWMAGTSETTFAPDLEVTRGMIVTVLAKIAGADLTKYAEPAFTDTKAGVWYTNACAWAAAEGLVAGVGDGRFLPKQNITRQDLVTILYKFIRMQEWNIPADGDRTFNDWGAVAPYAVDAVRFCAATELVTGYPDGGFHPKDTATRAQLAVILKKMDVLAHGGTLPTDPKPAQSFEETDEGVNVKVDAPENALPENTNLTVRRVTDEAALAALQAKISGNVIAAADISFTKDGAEIEPQEEVEVLISLDDLDDSLDLHIVHVKDDGTLELMDSELVAAYSQNHTGNAPNAISSSIKFYSKDFSVYLIIDGEVQPPVPQVYRRTYKFTTNGTNPFEFYNKAGKKVSQQIVKNGDELEKVRLPYEAAHTFQNWVVSASDDPAVPVGTNIDLPLPINDIGNADTVVTLKPAYGNVYYVTFHAKDAGATPDVIQTKKIVVEGEKVVIGDVQAPSLDETDIFFGWTDDPDGQDDPIPVYDSDNHLVTTTEYPDPITANLDLYPFFEQAFWLRFVSGETGSRASYVPARFVLADEKVTKLDVSTRTGYTFDGWYTGSQDEAGAITYGNQVTDGNGNVINPSDGLSLTQETVLYGHWTARTDASYKVVIWRQKVTDDKDAEDSAKTYDYADSDVREGVTDAPVDATNADRSHSGGDYKGFHYARTVQTSPTIQADGSTVINVYYDRDLTEVIFYYRDGNQPDDAEASYDFTAVNNQSQINGYVQNGTQLYGRKADGSYAPVTPTAHSTTRVYYTYGNNQTEYTGTFYTRGTWIVIGYLYNATQYNGNNLPPANDTTTYYTEDLVGLGLGHQQLTRRTESVTTYTWAWEDGTAYEGTLYIRSVVGGDHPYKVTWSGLYGQSFSQNDYTWPADTRWTESVNGGTTQTFLADFVRNTNPYSLYDQGNPGNSVIYHYKQDLDGKYKQTAGLRYEAHGSGGSFNFENKFEGFEVTSYNTPPNGFNTNGGSNTDLTNTPNTYPLHVYHTRKTWTISYQATADAQSTRFEEVTNKPNIYYEQPLATVDDQGNITSSPYDLSAEEAGLAERTGYTFSGWYADETCTQLFDFNSKMPNANVTVYAGWEPVWYQVLVDPDGGIITPDIGSTYFWESYHDAEKVSRYEIVRPYIEDPNGTYAYVYVDGLDDPDGNIKVRTATYVPWTEEIGGPKYRPIDLENDASYTLLGWYDVDFETGETTDTPHDFDAEIEGPVWIRAVWNLGGDYGLQYNATKKIGDDIVSGSFTQDAPDARYADGAEVVLDAPPTNVTDQYVFEGWEIVEPDVGDTPGAVLDDNSGKYYQPGEALILDAAKWSRQRIIYLRAHYSHVDISEEPVGVTYLQFQPNFPEGADGAIGDATAVKYYPLNESVDLGQDEFVPRNYGVIGYRQIGWSQNKNAAPVVHADGAGLGEIVFSMTDIIGLDNVSPTQEVAQYVDEQTGETKNVRCNILYAIWQPVCYVYHSSTGMIEAIEFTKGGTDTIDLVAKVPSGYLYGGYYKDFGGVTAENLKAAQYFANSNLNGQDSIAANYAQVAGAEIYDGSSTKASNNTRFWTRTKAYGYSGTADRGDALKPTEAGTVYYVKEVPDDYLTTKYIYTYKLTDSKIQEFFMLTLVDDSYYDTVGFRTKDGAENMQQGTENVALMPRQALAGTVSITQSGSGDQPPTSLKVNASNFGKDAGYVAILQSNANISAENSFSLVPAWRTYDKVEVNSHGALKLTVNEELTAISYVALPGSKPITYNTLYVDTQYPTAEIGSWETAGAITKLYFYGAGVDKWVTMTKVQTNLYTADIPTGNWSHVIIVRCAPGSENQHDWGSTYWCKTGDIALDRSKNLITVYSDLNGHDSAANQQIFGAGYHPENNIYQP